LKDGLLTNAFVGNEAAYQQYQHRRAANNIETTTMLSAETGRIGAASCGSPSWPAAIFQTTRRSRLENSDFMKQTHRERPNAAIRPGSV
jgi:hypothetical protein